MSEEEQHSEAPNPFDQTQLQDSLNYTSNFWKEENPTLAHQGSAYDNIEDANYETQEQNNNNAYDDNSKNAISKIYSNLKNKMTENENINEDQNINNDYYEINDSEQDNIPKKPKKIKKKKIEPQHMNHSQINLTHDELDKREEALARKEKALNDRRNRLDAVRHELNATNIRRDNWPCSYYPILFHSIKQEIPPYARGHMKKMYYLVLFTFFIFILNTLTQIILYVSDATESDTDILLSVLYLICGIVGAWRLWYRQIYYGIRDRKTMKWWCFFFFFAAHVGFCFVMCIGIKSWGGAGIIIMIDAFGNSKSSFGGFCALVCVIIWGSIGLASLFYLKKSWYLYKQRGGVEQAKGEFAAQVAQHAADQLV